MKSILRILVASSAMLLVLSPALAAPVAEEVDGPAQESADVEHNAQPGAHKGTHAAAGVYGTLECTPDELYYMCTADNVGTRCNQLGVYVPNDVYRERCKRACTCT